MSILSCDRDGCEKMAHGEIYVIEDEEHHTWCYACFWHYLIERIRRILGLNGYGFCKIDNTREAIEFVRMELWNIQGDLIQIKEKLGIKDEEIDEIKKNIDVT